MLLARSRFRGLATIGPDGRPVLALAEEVVVRDNDRRFAFTLREDAVFSDGRPITASDVIGTLSRLVRPSTASPHAQLLDLVVGYEAVASGSATQLAGVTADGPRRVVVRLGSPFADFVAHLAHPALGIMPGAARGGKLGPGAPSSGPFVLEKAETGRRALLIRNLRAPRATAFVESLDLRVVADGARSLRAGAVDAAYLASAGPDRLVPRWGTLSLGVNMRTLTDAGNRRAITQAINREALAASGDQPWIATSRIVPADLGGKLDAPGGSFTWRGRGPVRLVHLDDPASSAFGARIAESLTAAKIPVQRRRVPASAYPSVLDRRSYDLVQLGWLSEAPTPDSFLGDQLGGASDDNQVGYASSAFDRLIAKARSTGSAKARAEAYADAERRALADAPLIPVVQLGVPFDVAPRVRGVALDGSGTFDAATAWFVPA